MRTGSAGRKVKNELRATYRAMPESERSWRAVAERFGLRSGATAYNIAHGKQPPPPELISRMTPARRKVRRLYDLPASDIARRLRDRFAYAPTAKQRTTLGALIAERNRRKRNLRQYQ